MKKTLILIAALISVLFILSWGPVDRTPPDTLKFIPLEPEIWVDNYLSPNHKDTIEVRLWSNSQQRYLDSIPDPASMESSMDWSFWFQDNEVETVLILKDFAPLRIPDATGLYYCGSLEEGDHRAVAIVPCIAFPADIIQCDIYTLDHNRWEPLSDFTTTPSLFYGETEPEPSGEWLIRKDGRWMYRDYLNLIKEEDTSFHYVFN